MTLTPEQVDAARELLGFSEGALFAFSSAPGAAIDLIEGVETGEEARDDETYEVLARAGILFVPGAAIYSLIVPIAAAHMEPSNDN